MRSAFHHRSIVAAASPTVALLLAAVPARADLPASWQDEQKRLAGILQRDADSGRPSLGNRGNLARWAFIRRVGPDALESQRGNAVAAAFTDSLYNSPPRIEKFLANTTEQDKHRRVLEIWASLWQAEKAELRPKYENLMLAVAALFDDNYATRIGTPHRYTDEGAVIVVTQDDKNNASHTAEFQMSPASRYGWYRDHFEAGKLFTDPSRFEPWEFKYIVNIYRTDLDLDWALAGLHDRNPGFFGRSKEDVRANFGWNVYGMVPYVWPWGGNMGRYLEEMAVNGAVCGGQSDFCQACAQAHGIPAAKQGGPGHGWMAWKGSEESGWITTGGGGYDPARATYRDDFYEFGSRGQSRLTFFHLPALHGAKFQTTELWLCLAELAADLGNAKAEKACLLGALEQAGPHPYAWERVANRLEAMKETVAPADWTRMVDLADATFLPTYPDAFYDILGRIWNLEESKVLPALTATHAAERLGRRRNLLIARLPQQSGLLLDVVRREMRYRQQADKQTDLAAGLHQLIESSRHQSVVVALGRAELDMVRGKPVRFETTALKLNAKLSTLPVTDLGERIGFQSEMQPYRGFGNRKLGEWGKAGLEGAKIATSRLNLPITIGKITEPVQLRLLFLPKAGPHTLKVHKVTVKQGDNALSTRDQAFDVHLGAHPPAVALDIPPMTGQMQPTVEITWQGPGGNEFAGDINFDLDPRPDYGAAQAVGGWGKQQFNFDAKVDPWQEIEVADLTPHIKGLGHVFLEARYSSYEKGVFAWMKLYKNGSITDVDLHAGDSRGDDFSRRYHFYLRDYDRTAKYTVRAKMLRCGGWGQVVMAPRPME